ncbi:MAG: transposase [Desulfobacterales bacterium]|nr:transposase [Desulfobacterales bacterium]
MARPLRITYPGAFYHITSRGNERKAIFKGRADRLRFLAYLESATERYRAVIHCYCLMVNHYHLLLETPLGNLPQIMRHINGAYTTYFNIKRDRSGHLFQGRYKAILVEKDAYARELSRYIHLNPVRAGIVAKPEAYEWTSYAAYVGARPPSWWLLRGFILGYFGRQEKAAQKRYKAFVASIPGWPGVSPLKNLPGGMILGRRQFVDTIRAAHISDRLPGRDLPALKELQNKPQLSHIEAMVDRIVEKDAKLARNLKIYFIRKCSGTPLKAIGERYGLGESGVSQVGRRLDKRKAEDAALRLVIAKIDRAIKK